MLAESDRVVEGDPSDFDDNGANEEPRSFTQQVLLNYRNRTSVLYCINQRFDTHYKRQLNLFDFVCSSMINVKD